MTDAPSTSPSLPPPVVTHDQHVRPALVVALIAAAAGVAAGLLIGVGVGWLAIASSDCASSDGWCQFGAGLVAVLLGTAAGAVTYVTAGVITIARCRPVGRRRRLIGVHIALPPAVVALAALLGALIEAVS